MSISPKELLEKITTAQSEYAHIFRKSLSISRYELALKQKLLNPDDLLNELVRESDLEHVGHLPMLATMIHPYLEHRDEVDLSKALLYLSLHEAPERIVGDVLHENKDSKYADDELAAAAKIYSGDYQHYFELYQEFHFLKNINAQFAYSMDRLAAAIYCEVQDAVARRARWRIFGLTLDQVRQRSMPYMEWDKTLYDLYQYILETIKQQDQ